MREAKHKHSNMRAQPGSVLHTHTHTRTCILSLFILVLLTSSAAALIALMEHAALVAAVVTALVSKHRNVPSCLKASRGNSRREERQSAKGSWHGQSAACTLHFTHAHAHTITHNHTHAHTHTITHNHTCAAKRARVGEMMSHATACALPSSPRSNTARLARVLRCSS